MRHLVMSACACTLLALLCIGSFHAPAARADDASDDSTERQLGNCATLGEAVRRFAGARDQGLAKMDAFKDVTKGQAAYVAGSLLDQTLQWPYDHPAEQQITTASHFYHRCILDALDALDPATEDELAKTSMSCQQQNATNPDAIDDCIGAKTDDIVDRYHGLAPAAVTATPASAATPEAPAVQVPLLAKTQTPASKTPRVAPPPAVVAQVPKPLPQPAAAPVISKPAPQLVAAAPAPAPKPAPVLEGTPSSASAPTSAPTATAQLLAATPSPSAPPAEVSPPPAPAPVLEVTPPSASAPAALQPAPAPLLAAAPSPAAPPQEVGAPPAPVVVAPPLPAPAPAAPHVSTAESALVAKAPAPVAPPVEVVAPAAPAAKPVRTQSVAGTGPASAEGYGKLKLGMPLMDAIKLFHSYPDIEKDEQGADSYVFLVADGNAFITLRSSPTHPGELYGIQITGGPEAKQAPLAGVLLGDTASDLLAKVGQPSARTPVKDYHTMWSYVGRNYSFEVSDGGDVISLLIYGYEGTSGEQPLDQGDQDGGNDAGAVSP